MIIIISEYSLENINIKNTNEPRDNIKECLSIHL
jgi:hypothetical protein